MAAGDLGGRLIAIIEPRSNTMKLGIHQTDPPRRQKQLTSCSGRSLKAQVLTFTRCFLKASPPRFRRGRRDSQLVKEGSAQDDQIVIMSNGEFDNIHQKLLSALRGTPGLLN